jgi:hypothetical protein
MSSANSAWHLPPEALARYSNSAAQELEIAWVASVEAHLDGCAACRAGLAPPLVDVQALDEVRVRLMQQSGQTVQHRRPRRVRIQIFSGIPLPWLLAAIAASTVATGFDLVDPPRLDNTPSILLLLAPILPLIGVGAAWTPRLDPMYEVTASTPAAGLPMLLRRTVLTLLPIVLASAGFGMATGTAPPGLWLLPCLALTSGALALGSLISLPVAAAAVAGAWSVLTLAPALIHGQSTVLLSASARPGWLAALALTGALVVLHHRAYRRHSPTSR